MSCSCRGRCHVGCCGPSKFDLASGILHSPRAHERQPTQGLPATWVSYLLSSRPLSKSIVLQWAITGSSASRDNCLFVSCAAEAFPCSTSWVGFLWATEENLALTVGPLHISLSYLFKICVRPLATCFNKTFSIVMAYERIAQSLSMLTCTLGQVHLVVLFLGLGRLVSARKHIL